MGVGLWVQGLGVSVVTPRIDFQAPQGDPFELAPLLEKPVSGFRVKGLGFRVEG